MLCAGELPTLLVCCRVSFVAAAFSTVFGGRRSTIFYRSCCGRVDCKPDEPFKLLDVPVTKG